MNVSNRITSANSIPEILKISKKHYSKYNNRKLCQMFNKFIWDRKFYEEKYSIRTMNEVCVLLSLHHKQKNIYISSKVQPINEKNILTSIIKSFEKIDLIERMDQDNKFTSAFELMDVEIAYQEDSYNYSTISIGDYLYIFRKFNKLSEYVYGVSIYELCEFFLEITSNCDFAKGWFSKEEMLKLTKKFNISLNNSFFVVAKDFNREKKYLSDIKKIFTGKIGIEFEDGYFIPSSPEFVFDNIYRGLLNKGDLGKKRGKLFQNLVYEEFSNYLSKFNIEEGYYISQEYEQDIICFNEKSIYIIECKGSKFHSVPRNKEIARERLLQKFKSVPLSAYKQAKRVENYINDGDNIIYFYNNKEENVFSLKKNNQNIFKIVVTLDDYYNLSESPESFVSNEDSKEDNLDVWIVNIFELRRIMWACDSEKLFERYIKSRMKNNSVSSASGQELEHFGLFINSNLNFMENGNEAVFLDRSFSAIFDEYDKVVSNNEINLLKN